MRSSSFSSRYLAKLLNNFISVGLNFLSLGLITRALTADEYSQFEYVSNTFTNIISGTAFAIPVAYFVYVSKNDSDRSIAISTTLTSFFYIAQYIILCLLVSGSIILNFSDSLWPGIGNPLLFLGLSFCSIGALFDIYGRLGDARALTKEIEIKRFVQTILRFFLIVLLFYSKKLNPIVLLILNIGINFVGILSIKKSLKKANIQSGAFSSIFNFPEVRRDFIKFIIDFSRPLITFTILGLLIGLSEKWLVQNSGSEQYAYYSLGFKISSLSSIFLSAATPLFTRDVARYKEADDRDSLFITVNRIKYFLALACFLSSITFAFSKEFIDIIGGGSKYFGAVATLNVLALYPIHQTLGQFCCSYYYAVGNTNTYAKLQRLSIIGGIILSYFLIAPKHWIIPGYELGALGYSIRIVLLNIIGNLALLWFVVKDIKDSFFKWVMFQLIIVGEQCLSALLSRYIIIKVTEKLFLEMGFATGLKPYVLLGGGVLIHGIFTVSFLIFAPKLMGFSSGEILEIKKLAKKYFPQLRNTSS